MESSLEQRPDQIALAAAIRKRWWLVVILTVVGVGAGLAAGLVAKPTYTSDTELLVGSPNATVQAVPGFAAATESLASSYSRAAQSSQVIAPVARQLGLPLGIVAARLAVTPIPDSNIITVVASGPSSAAAQTLARATASELTKYVNQSQAQGGLSTVLAAYRSAARAAIVARNTLRSLRALHSKPPEAAFTKAETAISVTQVRAQALSSEYSAVLQQNESAAGISVLSEPVGASSNRKSTVQKTAIVGLLVGLVLGALLAFLIEARRQSGSFVS